MSLSFFDMLNEICEHKSDLDFDDPEINKAYDMYMINRYLSMTEFLIPFVNMVNHSGIEKKDHYAFLKALVPKSNYKFQYIKKTTDINYEDAVKYLCLFFDIGLREAKMYIPLIAKKHIESLESIYSYGKNGKSIAADAD